mgnify:CR=1 FL=1
MNFEKRNPPFPLGKPSEEDGLVDFNLLKENELVTIKGICTGYLMDVVLVKSEIVN